MKQKNSRNVFLLLVMMIFVFGVLHLTVRTLLMFAVGIFLAYGAEILLLYHFKPESLDVRLELLQWVTLALTPPRYTQVRRVVASPRKTRI